MKTYEILEAAKAVLLTKGWHQGSFFGKDGSACASGAIRLVYEELYHPDSYAKDWVCSDAYTYLNKAVGDWRISNWNDMKGRTFEEVLAAFDKAIALAKEKEQPEADQPIVVGG